MKMLTNFDKESLPLYQKAIASYHSAIEKEVLSISKGTHGHENALYSNEQTFCLSPFWKIFERMDMHMFEGKPLHKDSMYDNCTNCPINSPLVCFKIGD